MKFRKIEPTDPLPPHYIVGAILIGIIITGVLFLIAGIPAYE